MDLSPIAKAVVLGLVEGATEFIPVSSTGHLIVAAEWLDFTGESAKTFETSIQLGVILAIAWLYRATFLRLALDFSRDPAARRLTVGLAVAFLPAAIIGFLAHGWIKAHLFNSLTVAISLILGGLLIFIIERWKPEPRVKEARDVPWRTALGIGLAQVLSLVPGTSRSGATIMGGFALGLTRRAATEFSFFLAVPVMLAATAYDLFKSRDALSAADIPLFAVGFVVAFISALLVVRVFLSFVSRMSFAPFAWYRIGLGVLLLWMHATQSV
jgi:undecaprenyl-diphosphatase